MLANLVASSSDEQSAPFASAVDSMCGSMFLPREERSNRFATFVSALEAAELEQLCKDMKTEANTKLSIEEFARQGRFPDQETLSDPAALLIYLRTLVGGPVVPTQSYKQALLRPDLAAQKIKDSDAEKWELLQHVARQIAHYKAQGKNYSRNDRSTIEKLEQEMLPYILRPSKDSMSVPTWDRPVAMKAMKKIMKIAEDEPAALCVINVYDLQICS